MRAPEQSGAFLFAGEFLNFLYFYGNIPRARPTGYAETNQEDLWKR